MFILKHLKYEIENTEASLNATEVAIGFILLEVKHWIIENWLIINIW